MGFLGNAVKRVEDPALLRGKASFTDNIHLPGQLYVAFVRSYEAHARIRGIDTSEALAVPGVVAVFTAADLEPVPVLDTCGGYMPVPGMEQPLLAGDKVHFVGEAVAAVVASSRYAAADGVAAVEVDYEPLPAVIDPEQALAPDAPVVFEDWGSNLIVDTAEEAMPDDLFAEADVVIEMDIANQRVASASLEPRSVLVGPHPETGELTLWSSNQHPQKLHSDACALLGLDSSELRVIAPDVGGGFGAKSLPYPEEILLVLLARRLGQPVTWTETRTENMLTTVHGRSQVHHMKIGAKRDGTIVALGGEVIADCGSYPNLGPLLMSMTTQMAPGVYRIPNVHVTAKGVVTTTAPIGAFRGAGRPEATFTIEQAMDRVAWELGLDPAEVRRKNLIGPDEFPFVTATGMTYDSGRYEVCLDALLEALDYETLRKEQARRREEGGPLLGIGISTYVEITGALGFGEDGSVEILDDGRVRVVTGTSPHGQGHRTAWAQLVADSLGLDSIDGIEVLHGDTKVAPNGAGTFGSRSLQFGGSAVRLAAVAMADKLRELAAHALEASPDDIELSGGGAHVRGTPSIALSLADLKAVAADPARRPDGFDADGNGNGDGDGRLTTHHFFEQEGWTFPCGAHGVVVEIDTDTGSVKIKRVVAVDDCGTVLNPMIVEGQVHGGLTQGLAQALWEGVSYSPEGQPLTTNFADYTVPSACEVPFYETISIQTPSPLNPLGAKGVGESGTIGSTPAAVSAVLDGLRPLGITNIDMPLTPEKVWKAVQEVAR